MKQVYDFIEKLNINNKYVVAAISGGPDSIFLLKLLIELKDIYNYNIVVCHVHHNLRKESDYEASKVKEFCEKNNLIFEYKKIEKYSNNKFSEVEARKIRYEFFDSIVHKYKTDILFTAHHGDDLIETVLMRLTRGSSLKGYAGIKTISTDRGYIIARPLLYLTKAEILKKLDKDKIWYAVDMSNNDIKYTRNRYRKYILPELKKDNENVHLKFLEYNEKILLADSYLESVANKFNIKNKEIDINEFNKLDEIIKIYVLKNYLKNIYLDNITLINYSHIKLIMNYLSNNQNLTFNLPDNYIAVVEYNTFKIIKKNIAENYNFIFNDYIEIPQGIIEIDNLTNLTTNYVTHLDSNDIKLPFHVRNMKIGDYIILKGMNKKKKVSDIFTNCKLTKELRKNYPIVTDDLDNIIWIPGIKKSNFDRKKCGKYDIILKYSLKEK